MLHYVYQRVTNFVSVLFGVGLYGTVDLSELFSLSLFLPKTAVSEIMLMRAMRLNQNSKVVDWKTKTITKRHLKLWGTVNLGDNFVWVHHHEQPF